MEYSEECRKANEELVARLDARLYKALAQRYPDWTPEEIRAYIAEQRKLYPISISVY